VRLYAQNGSSRCLFVHRLIAQTWVPNPDTDTQDVVNHLDGCLDNWAADNLEWTTAVGNSLHARELGLVPRYTGRIGLLCTDELTGDARRYASVPEASNRTGASEASLRDAIAAETSFMSCIWAWEAPNVIAAEVWQSLDAVHTHVAYEVSDHGRVRNAASERHLKNHTTHSGYHINVGHKETKRMLTHRLVAMTFLAPPGAGQTEVDHIDGNPLNNNVTNLRWILPKTHAKKTHCKAVDQLDSRGNLVATHASVNEAARSAGKHPGQVSRVLRGDGHTCGGFRWRYHRDPEPIAALVVPADPEMDAYIDDLVETFEGL
jgi:hypothetical protein